MHQSGLTLPGTWRIIIDANTDDLVGSVFSQAGADVVWANRAFAPGTEDAKINDVAKVNGQIVVSHDRRFLQMIQQRRFQFDIPAASGYGRILLCGREDRQPDRVREVLSLLSLVRTWAVDTDRRFIVTIADNWIRFDDKPIARTIPS